MSLALGSLSTLLATCAAAITSGAVLGGFVGGLRGVLLRRARHDLEFAALRLGYAGGLVGLAVLGVDALM